MDINKITEEILNGACKVHTELGPGLLVSTSEECLYYELRLIAKYPSVSAESETIVFQSPEGNIFLIQYHIRQ